MEIKIYRNYLKLSVDTETRKAGLAQINGDNPELLNEAQLGTEFSDLKYFERKCQEGVDALLNLLHRYVTKCNSVSVNAADADNKLTDTTCWVITLSMDSRRNIITSALASECHKFITYNMLYSWSVMTMPNLSTEYKTELNQSALDIQRMIYRKEPPVLEYDVDSVTLSKVEVTLPIGGYTTIQATVRPSKASQIVAWESNNEQVATIDDAGKITGVGLGLTKVVCNASGVKAECDVIVIQSGEMV